MSVYNNLKVKGKITNVVNPYRSNADIALEIFDESDTLRFNILGDGMTVVNNSITANRINIADEYIYENLGYTATVAKPSGLVVNYLPTSTVDTVAGGGFTTAGAGNATCDTTAVGPIFSAGDIVQIINVGTAINNGLYEVLSHASNVLTVLGGTSPTLQDFTNGDFITNTTIGGTITKVTVSVMRAGADGVWEYGTGSTNAITYSDLVDVASAVNTAITGTGALDAGSITSNFGSIDVGASAITTTGTVSSGTFDGTNATLNGYIQFADVASPANPLDGQGRLYKKTGNDGIFWKPNSAGAEVDLTDTSGGGPSTYIRTPVTNAESPYTILSSDEIIGIDTSAGTVTVTLPDISLIGGDNYKKYFIVDEGGSSTINNITVATTGGDTINKNASPLVIVADHTSITLYSDGTSNWVIL